MFIWFLLIGLDLFYGCWIINRKKWVIFFMYDGNITGKLYFNFIFVVLVYVMFLVSVGLLSC